MGLGFLSKVRWALKTYGPVKALYWMFFGYFRINRFYIYRGDLAAHGASVDNEMLEAVIASPEQLAAVQSSLEFQTYEAFINTYLKTSVCIIGYVNSHPVHIMWVFRKGDDSRLFNLEDNDAELNYCFTTDSSRGQGIYTKMIGKASALLKRQGVTTLYMATHETNIPAQRAISKAGLKNVGMMMNIGILYRPKWQ